MSHESVLGKKGWRTDSIWTRSAAYNTILNRIPLFFDLKALERSQYWPRPQLRKLQEDRLRSLLSDAKKVPFWREHFARHAIAEDDSPWEVLARLPIVKKSELAAGDINFITDSGLRTLSAPDHTSGSTGRPFNFFFDRHAELRSFAITERLLRMATEGVRYPVVYLRSRPRNGFTYLKHIWFYLRGYNGVKYRIDDLIEVVSKCPQGVVLYGYTSSIVELARCMKERGTRLPVRAVMATGEGIRQSERQFIKDALNTDFYHVYASRELGWLASECTEHALHLSEEWAYIEIVDDDGRLLPAGTEGRIIVTTFDNRVMPFIRYEIGDRGIINDEPCVCGRTLRTIRLTGRIPEFIRLDSSRTVSLLDILANIDAYADAIRQFQIIHAQPLAFVIKVVPGVTFAHDRDRIEKRLIRLLHPSAKIIWEVVDHIPAASSGKARYFVPYSNIT